MFPISLTSFDVRLMERRERLADTGDGSLLGQGQDTRRSGGRRIVAAVWRSLGRRIAPLVADSRDPLRTEELVLAARGFTWGDEQTDRELAIELRAARQRRQALASLA